jgi:hypothetical protein
MPDVTEMVLELEIHNNNNNNNNNQSSNNNDNNNNNNNNKEREIYIIDVCRKRMLWWPNITYSL